MHNIDYRYLRPQKSIALKKWYDESFSVCHNPEVWIGKNATILPLRKIPTDSLQFGRGGVVDCNGNYIVSSCVKNRIEYAYPYTDPEYKDEKVVYCGYLINQWGHFLIEAVARLWYFLENDQTVDRYVFFLDEHEEREIKGNYREFLELLKIWDKLEFINKPTTYREVIVPELGYQFRNKFAAKQLHVFETVATNISVDPSWKTFDKIYCSRSMFAKAQSLEFGFDMLDNFFAKNGYQVLFPEKIPLSQMIYYIRNAKIIAALQGSVCHNVLFAKNGQCLEVVDRQVISDDNQVDINRMRHLNVTYIDANIPIYTIDCAGPYIMGYTNCLQKFTADRGYLPPDDRYLTKAYNKKCFINYMKAYQDLFRYNWFMHDWYGPFTDSLYEGFQEGHSFFGEYLDGSKPFLWHHYFELHYLKQFIKRILFKLGILS